MYVTYSMKKVAETQKYYEMIYDTSHHLIKIDQETDWNFVTRQLEMFYSIEIKKCQKNWHFL